ncbi:hypothetical protein DFJ74DRAFT_454252 [Hyaloraphidium curvatum]|nr:hypothetical protein DFJ74DRAFT_454252 [Hyaloraphidium curvatum]
MAAAFIAIAASVAVALFGSVARLYGRFAAGGRADPGNGPAAKPGEPDYSSHALAGLVRWSELAHAEGATRKDGHVEAGKEGAAENAGHSRLLEHWPDDAFCPCPAKSCAGHLIGSTAALAVLGPVSRMVPLTAAQFLIVSNPTFLYAARFWASPWALAGAVALVGILDYVPVNFASTFSPNVALLRLAMRVQRRATFLALRGFLDRAAAALDGRGAASLDGRTELYARLHYRLTLSWERRATFGFLVSNRVLVATGITCTAIPLLINLAAGPCVPAYVLCFAAWTVLMVITDLVHVALANEQIERVTELYAQAQAEIRDALSRLPRGTGHRGDAAAVLVLERHDRLLDSFRAEVLRLRRLVRRAADLLRDPADRRRRAVVRHAGDGGAHGGFDMPGALKTGDGRTSAFVALVLRSLYSIDPAHPFPSSLPLRCRGTRPGSPQKPGIA